MILNGNQSNPISIEWKYRYLAQPPEIQEKLDAINNMNPKEYQLKMIKRSKNELKDGDIFVLSPREDVYFYGKVLKANINHTSKDPFIDGKNLIFIFQSKSKEINLLNFKADYNKLLIKPEIVDRSYWTKGLFFTIGNEEITHFEKDMDYGFYKHSFGKYYKEDGVEINHKPPFLGIYGIATITGVASKIEKELIINPSLLEF
jgi:hypothetical protein